MDRKYALLKLAVGDYLLPSNDGQTLWRISRYTDGPSTGLDEWSRDRSLWRLLHWCGEIDIKRDAESFIDLSMEDRRWLEVKSCLPTRRAAIDVALARVQPG